MSHLAIPPPVREALLAAAARHGTPAYAYHLPTVTARCTRLRAALAATGVPFELLYAVKANACRAVVQAVLDCGFGAECVSEGEVRFALALGAKRVLYTNNNVPGSELAAVAALAAAHEPGRVWINCDSIQRIAELPRGSSAFIRINGAVGGGHHDHVITCGPASKFGIPHEMVPAAAAAATAAGVSIIGVHQHIGSGVMDPDRYAAAVDVLSRVLVDNAAALPHVAYVDFGGGIGVPYRPGDVPIDVEALAATVAARFVALRTALGRREDELTLLLEPGRYPVAGEGGEEGDEGEGRGWRRPWPRTMGSCRVVTSQSALIRHLSFLHYCVPQLTMPSRVGPSVQQAAKNGFQALCTGADSRFQHPPLTPVADLTRARHGHHPSPTTLSTPPHPLADPDLPRATPPHSDSQHPPNCHPPLPPPPIPPCSALAQSAATC
jgi:diaminopimelate decarboxylase